jgi:hypothetical protein
MTDWHWSRVRQLLASALTRRSVRPKPADAAADDPSEAGEPRLATRLSPVTESPDTKSSICSVPAGWARSIVPATPVLNGSSS